MDCDGDWSILDLFAQANYSIDFLFSSEIKLLHWKPWWFDTQWNTWFEEQGRKKSRRIRKTNKPKITNETTEDARDDEIERGKKIMMDKELNQNAFEYFMNCFGFGPKSIASHTPLFRNESWKLSFAFGIFWYLLER